MADGHALIPSARGPQTRPSTGVVFYGGACLPNVIDYTQPLQSLPPVRVEFPTDPVAPVSQKLPSQLLLVLQRGNHQTTGQVISACKPCQVMQIQIGYGRGNYLTVAIHHRVMYQRQIQWNSAPRCVQSPIPSFP